MPMKQDFISKILDVIDDKGEIIGGALGVISDPIANGRGFSKGTLDFVLARLKGWRLVNPMDVLSTMASLPEAYPLFDAVFAALGGWALNEFGSIVDPRLAKLGRGVKKGAIANAIGQVIGAHLWLPAVMPGGQYATNTISNGGGMVTY